MQPLQGITVVALIQVVAAPFATRQSDGRGRCVDGGRVDKPVLRRAPAVLLPRT